MADHFNWNSNLHLWSDDSSNEKEKKILKTKQNKTKQNKKQKNTRMHKKKKKKKKNMCTFKMYILI